MLPEQSAEQLIDGLFVNIEELDQGKWKFEMSKTAWANGTELEAKTGMIEMWKNTFKNPAYANKLVALPQSKKVMLFGSGFSTVAQLDNILSSTASLPFTNLIVVQKINP